jgi:hypothetical protein
MLVADEEGVVTHGWRGDHHGLSRFSVSDMSLILQTNSKRYIVLCCDDILGTIS